MEAPPLLLELWIPGRVISPNQMLSAVPVRKRSRGPSRWSMAQDMKDKAKIIAMRESRAQRVTLRPPVKMAFTMCRMRLLDLEDNERAALKYFRDGLVEQLLSGSDDGPESGNIFVYTPQEKVLTAAEEGVRVRIYQL